MAQAHADVGDYVRKDGSLVKITRIDLLSRTYRTSDGGCMSFEEVPAHRVLLESEVHDEAPAPA